MFFKCNKKISILFSFIFFLYFMVSIILVILILNKKYKNRVKGSQKMPLS